MGTKQKQFQKADESIEEWYKVTVSAPFTEFKYVYISNDHYIQCFKMCNLPLAKTM